MTEPKRGKAPAGFDIWPIVGTALVTVIIVLVNYIAARRYVQWDFTREGLFTLSGRTEELLKKLDKPVDVYLFMSEREGNFADMRALITRYQAKTDKIRAHFIDPDREPTKFRALAEQHGLRDSEQENGQTAALVTAGPKRWTITRDDLVNIDYDSLGQDSGGAKVNVKSEQALTGAIVQVTSGRPTKVCISEGHGEWPLEGTDRSLMAVKQELERENVVLESLATRGKAELKGCDALFVVGPSKAFASEEADALKKYVDGGGNLLLALDPVLSGEQIQATGLESFAEALGVHIDRDVVVELDPERLLTPSPIEQFIVLNYGDHAITRPLVALGAPIVMMLARTFSVSEAGEAEVLMQASEKAYGETQLGQLTAGDALAPGDGDVKGRVTLAAVVDTRPEPEGGGAEPRLGGRVVFVGDSEWLLPALISQPQVANVDFLAAVTGFLTERKELVSIAPRKINAQAIMITEDGLMGIFLRAVVLMPLAALIFGVGIWWQRRA